MIQLGATILMEPHEDRPNEESLKGAYGILEWQMSKRGLKEISRREMLCEEPKREWRVDIFCEET